MTQDQAQVLIESVQGIGFGIVALAVVILAHAILVRKDGDTK